MKTNMKIGILGYGNLGKGIKDARQYTVPIQAALDAVRSGSNPDLTTRQKHTRECFVVVEEELQRDHAGIPHGGFVIRTGKTDWDNEFNNVIEYSLKLDSNPAFTSSVLVAYARAIFRMNKEGQTGCKTVFDIAPAYLSPLSGEEIRAHLL